MLPQLASILALSANVGQVHIGKGRGELTVATLRGGS